MCDPALRQLHMTANRLVRAWQRWNHLIEDDRIRLIVEGDIEDLARAVDIIQPLLDEHYKHRKTP